jgi:hypothetical protein
MKLLDQLWALPTYLIGISSYLLTGRDILEPTGQVPLGGIPTRIHIDLPRGPVFKPPGGYVVFALAYFPLPSHFEPPPTRRARPWHPCFPSLIVK